MFNPALLRRAQPHWALLGLTFGLSLLTGVFTIAQAWLLSQVLSAAFLGGQALTALTPTLAALLGVIVARALAAGASEVAAGHLALRVRRDLRHTLLQHLLALGPTYTQGERTGELTTAVAGGVEALEPYFSQYLPQLAAAALIPLTILGFVFPLDWLSALVLVVTAPLIPFFMILIGKTAEALTRSQYHQLGRLSAHFLDVLQGLTTLKLLGQSRAQAQTVARLSDRYRLATMDVLRVAFLSALVLELVGSLSTALIAVEATLRLLAGRLEFQPAIAILILAPEFYLPLRLLGQRFHAAAAGTAAATRLFEILDQPAPASSAVTAPAAAARPPALTSTRAVTFRDVHYAYAGGRRPALHGVSFEIEAGQHVALVGPSGAGKSTIANLLLGFGQPDQGEVLLNGLPPGALPVETWRQQIAWVPQTPHLFHDTLAANIRLARPTASLAEIQQAAERAHLHDVIASLPRGYDTCLGEAGARLSGGQAQRVALARAFLKDAPLLILDEPTSSVDPELEAQLEAATAAIMQGRTVLLIAHRLSSLYRANRLVVLHAGRVAATGDHAALMSPGSVYRRLVDAALEAV